VSNVDDHSLSVPNRKGDRTNNGITVTKNLEAASIHFTTMLQSHSLTRLAIVAATGRSDGSDRLRRRSRRRSL